MTDRGSSPCPEPDSRRDFLRRAGTAGLAGVAAPLLARPPAHRAAPPGDRGLPIKHIIVCCQENHSFDHYFGAYSGLPAGYGIPAGFTTGRTFTANGTTGR